MIAAKEKALGGLVMKWKKLASHGAALTTLAVGAPTAIAASQSFPWTAGAFSKGSESRRWDSLGGNTQTQTSCTRTGGGRGGVVSYELWRHVSVAPDRKIGYGREFDCSLTDQTKSWDQASSGTYYWKLWTVPTDCLTPGGNCPMDLTGRTAYTTS